METELWQVLMDNGLDSYIKTLEENNIDKEILSELSEVDYAKLGITGESMRKMIKLFSKNPPYEYEPAKQETAILTQPSGTHRTALEQRKEDSLDNSPVRRRLIDNGLSEYIEVFAKNKLDTVDIVSKLTESDLSELGITIIGDRKKIKDIFNIRGEQPKDNNVVVTQTVKSEGGGGGGGTAHTGLAGVLGGIIGAIAVIVIILIIISNESFQL